MIKLYILVLLLEVFSGGFTCAVGNSGIPTEEQVQKLAAAAWKEPIENIDITYYKDITKVPEPVEQIRKRAEDVADEEFKGRSTDELKPYEVERRKKNIEINLKNWLEAQKFPRKIKNRVRISGNNQRIDFVKVGPDDPLGPNTPFVHTFINTTDAGNFVRYHYAGDMNTAFIETTKKWTKNITVEFAGIPSIAARALRAFLGKDQGGTLASPIFVPNPNKMVEVAQTGLTRVESVGGVKLKESGEIRIRISPDPNVPGARDIIEIGPTNYFPQFVLVCDKEDYSRVYRAEFHLPTVNQITYVRECSDFDSNGFPHNITETEWDKDGNFVEKSVYRIIQVELNPSIVDKVFEFSPPDDYKIVDRRLSEKQPEIKAGSVD